MSWQTLTIDQIKAPFRYACVGGPFGSDLTSRDYVDDGVPVIRGNNLSSEARFLDENFVFVSEDKAKALHTNAAASGDLIFTQRGTLGQVGLIPIEATHDRYIVSQSQMKLTVDSERVRPEFVYYYFRQPAMAELIRRRAITSGVPHINLGILKGLEIRIPGKREQDRIVTILSNIDAAIENNRRRMALLEEAARQLYREWFVRLRFPGHEHTRIANGVPAGWAWKTLSEIAEVNRESLSGSFDGEIVYVDIATVTPGQINETGTYDFCDAPSRARRIVRHGDIIWSCVRPNRRSHAVVWQPAPNLIASTGFAVISPKLLPTSYIYEFTTTDEFVGYLTNNAQGAAYPAVVASVFERAKLLVPTESLVRAFNDFAEPILDQRHNLRLQTQKLRSARDLLLPRLMSGEIAV